MLSVSIMEHLQGVLNQFAGGLPGGVGDKLKGYLNQYSQDSNGLLMLVVGLIVAYFALKMLMPMVQSVIIVAVVGLVGWMAFQKWGSGSDLGVSKD